MIRSTLICRVASLVGVAGVFAVVAAQENPLVPTQPGSWQAALPITPQRMATELTLPERTAVKASVNQLLEIVRRMPQMAPPAGFQVIPHAFVEFQNLDHSDGKRMAYATADILANLAPYERNGRGIAANEADTAAHVHIKVNDLAPLLGAENGLADDQGAFMQSPPEPVDTLHGYPVFEEGNGDRWIVICRNAVPFFAPVTVERYLRVKIAEAQRRLAEAKDHRAKVPAGVPASILTTIDDAIAGFQRQVNNDQRVLAAMSAAERAAPARVLDTTGDDAPRFGAADDAGATAIVYFNPALMAPDLPRTAPQILAVGIGATEERWPGLAAKLDHELDWTALDHFIHQR
jgi:hypothetical protein